MEKARILALTSLFILIGCIAVLGAGPGQTENAVDPETSGEEAIIEKAGYDTGCSLIYCTKRCTHTDFGWLCYTDAKYERYGYDPEQGWHDLPICVTAIADCRVYRLWVSSCESDESRCGEGVVQVRAECWIPVIFAGTGINYGGCECQELY